MSRNRAVAALAALALTAGCGGASVAARDSAGRVRVVAIENVWGDIARQVGGNHVTVTSILKDPSVDPHTFESDPRAAAAISGASFVIDNGLGYDAFADKLLRASKVSGRTTLTVAKVVGVSGDDVNPHLWYSPTYVRQAATAIAAQLTVVDAADRADFSAGLQRFLAAYQPYADTLAAIRATYDGVRVSYTERVPGYLLDAAGLRLGTPVSFSQAIEDGNDPSPKDIDAFRRALTGRTVKVLLYNAQVTSPVTIGIRKLATDAGLPVVGVTETLPADQPDFQTWQIAQAKAVLTALGGRR